MRKTTLILVSLLLAVCLTAYIAAEAHRDVKGDSGNSCNVILILEHRDAQGRLIERRVKTGDLLLENFGRLLLAFMKGGADYTDEKFQIKNTGGSWQIPFYSSSSQRVRIHEDNSYIVLGNGTASAALENYQMANQIMEQQVGSIGVSVSGDKVNGTLSTTFTFDGSYTIREIGLKTRIQKSASAFYFFICRDDISSNPITVANGDTLTVTYVFMLN